MSLLLDTHALIWYVTGDPRLSSKAAAHLSDSETRVFVSVVSAWELVIKLGTGKLTLDRPVADWWITSISENDFEVLPITAEDVLAVDPLPCITAIRSTAC